MATEPPNLLTAAEAATLFLANVRRVQIVALLAAASAAACARTERAAGGPVLVFAASDLRYALADLARDYRRAGGDSVVLVFGSTGELAAQIANGAPADLFFAANAQAVDDLAARALVVDSTRAVYAIGRLALIGACHPASGDSGSAAGAARCPAPALAGLAAPRVRAVAIADPSHAPYGLAARQALERSGLWARVQPKLVFGATVTQAYQFVETGNADAGIVALSLALRTPGRPYALVDTTLHEPLRQTAAVLTTSARPAAAAALLRYVGAGAGQAVMRRYGFTAPMPSAARPSAAR